MKKKRINKIFSYIFLDNQKRGQVWVETMIYTLIAFALIGTVLAFVKPKIEEMQDRGVIDQSILMLKEIEEIISDIDQSGVGNKRGMDIKIKAGELVIDSDNDKLIFELESNTEYSESGISINDGNIKVLTSVKGSLNKITLTLNCNLYNITFQEKDIPKILSKDTDSYDLYITNKGGNPTNIDFDVVK